MNPGRHSGATWLDDAAPLELSQTCLFLDIDGTIAPIVARPDQVGPVAGRTALLRALSVRLEGRLAVISGRAIPDIDRIVEGAVTAVAGVHGLQRRSADGRIHQAQPHPGLDVVRGRLAEFAAGRPGVLVEDKGLSIAIHYRAEPEAGDPINTAARRIATENGLGVQAGDQVVELRTPGQDKGDAIRAFMTEAPFAGGRPVFVGDDLTDEPAFETAARMGGYGLLVGPARPTHALRRLADCEAVLAWLDQAVLADANP